MPRRLGRGRLGGRYRGSVKLKDMLKATYTIRLASAEDATPIALLWAEMAKQHRAYNDEFWCWSTDAPDNWRKNFLDNLKDKDMITFVAIAPDGEALGFTQACVKASPPIYQTKRQGEVWDLVVSPEHREKGIGLKLMEATLGELEARGAQSVILHAAIANTEAIRLYEKLGMRRVMYRMYKRISLID